MPLLRGAVRGVSRDGNAAVVFRRRPQLSRQSLPWLRRVLSGAHTGAGAFDQLMPHNAMAALFGAAFLYAIIAIAMGVRAFWRDIGEPVGSSADRGSLWQAMRDAGELRYLDGGGVGCVNE